jgi:hypothetical protein
MTSQFGGVYFPQNATVRIVFGESLDYSYVDLPSPNIRELKPGKKVVTKEGFTGNTFFRDYGYRPTLELSYQGPSDTYAESIVKVMDYPGIVTIFPFFIGTIGQPFNGFAQTYRMRLVECDCVPIAGKNVQMEFKLKFEATQFYSKWLNFSAAICVVRGNNIVVTNPAGGETGDIAISIRPFSRCVTVGTPDKIFCVQNGFN